ncbi:MAG: hypothetical protein HYX63_06365 [Gammaproteobacteria bacterium]|nr:hypothetical protein [Gammaproteobacteria bacterium]
MAVGNRIPNHGARRAAAALGCALAALAGWSAPAYATDAAAFNPAPEPGHGYSLADLRLNLGGYITVRLKDLKGEPVQFDLRDINLLGTWIPTARWIFLAEFKVHNPIAITADRVSGADAEVGLERLYADYAVSPQLAMRVGKILTPIGRWNLTHADPLEWTVTRPLVTVLPFATRATGVSVHGALAFDSGNVLDYTLYVDGSKALDPLRDDIATEDIELRRLHNAFDTAVGGQLRYHFWDDRAELGASYSNIQVRGLKDRSHLFGVDGRCFWRQVEFTSEALIRYSDGTRENSEWGVFVQAAIPLVESLHAIVRLEQFKGDRAATRARLGTFGLAYRPQSSMVFKLEYRLGGHNQAVAPDGAFASASVLF